MTRNPIPPADDYFLEIESHFAARRGTPFIFSGKDWALMKAWKEEGIPLPVVLEAIESCFRKKDESPRRRTISSLSYCRHAVREMWEERKDLLVGSSESVPERGAAALLAELGNGIAAAAETSAAPEQARLLFAAAEAVRALPAHEAIPQLEERLIEIERALLDALLAALPVETEQELQAEVEKGLAGHKLDPKVAERTRRANLLRLMRRRLGMPRLSLFG
ncbi:MAG TPA: hypothetical protein VFV54_06840 [Thermoanaerobaculia bacterium]|nr:hypothetical protein [Thermoanaerobaculia bacterium]